MTTLVNFLEHWQSLIGSLIGAAGTVFAGWLAWRAVQTQMKRAADDRRRIQEAAKVAAVIEVAQAIHACSVLYANMDAIRVDSDTLEADFLLIEQLIPDTTIARDMEPNDRSIFLATSAKIRALVASNKSRPISQYSKTVLVADEILKDIEKYCTLLDADLGSQITKARRLKDHTTSPADQEH
ncbi:MAG TPA: hypothetical protein VNQ99_11175 [Xanthobacteraceae bacterium]|nr:hypothetical protein [Xanthobacteraceae bacterium]